MQSTWKSVVVLGGGRGTSRVDVWSPDTRDVAALLQLKPGSSIYALAIDDDGNRLAVGTKRGEVILLRKQTASDFRGEVEMALQFSQPILSLAFVDSRRLAIATRKDTFWIDVGDTQGHCHFLDTRGDIVCALCCPSTGHLHSISSQGQALEWRIPQGECNRRVCGPKPGGTWGIAKLIHWPEEHALVYGSSEGDLVVVSLEKATFVTHRAHDGEVYGMCAWKDRLITVGRTDERLKLWQTGCTEPALELKCPPGITAATVLDGNAERFLLVDEVGRAEVFDVQGDSLRGVMPLHGGSYRAVLGPDMAALARKREQENMAAVESTLEKAFGHIKREEWSVLDRCYRDLEALDYPHAALWLRAEAEKAKHDQVAELRWRLRLYHEYTRGDRRAAESTEQLARLLETLWHYSDAGKLYGELAAGETRDEFARKLKLAVQRGKQLADEHVIVDPGDVPLETVFGAALVLRKPCHGRWLIRTNQEYRFSKARLTAVDVLSHLEADPVFKDLSVVWKHEQAVIASRDAESSLDAIVFEDKARQEPFLQLILAFRVMADATIMTPTLVLVAVPVDAEDDSLMAQNQRLLDALVEAREPTAGNSWMRVLNRDLSLFLGRLYTEVLREQAGPV